MSDKHPLDQWEEDGKKAQEDFIRQALLDSSLVYHVFSTQAGQKLIERWKEVLIWSPTASKGEDSVSIGMNEGYKSFIRSILQAIKLHEEQQ